MSSVSNDAVLIGSIAFLFILIGAILPFTESAYVDISDDYREAVKNMDDLPNGLGYDEFQKEANKYNLSVDYDDYLATTKISSFEIIGSIFSMFFWTFDAVPLWLDITLFSLMRAIFWFTIFRNLWIGGGA